MVVFLRQERKGPHTGSRIESLRYWREQQVHESKRLALDRVVEPE